MRKAKKIIASSGLLCLFLLAMAVALHADQAKVVTAEAVKNTIEGKQKATLVDSRTLKEYLDERIPTAILIPVEDFEKQYGSLLPDKNALIIFYCNGVNCGKAPVAAEKAIKVGYTNVEVLGGGIPEWKEKGYPTEGNKAGAKRADIKKLSAETLKASIDGKEDLIVVDVREKDEFAAGHIQGAINLPLSSLEKSYDRLPLDKKVVLYCNSAARSNSAARILLQHDYQKIEEMEGFKFWMDKKFPSVKGE